jgi:hypothetical protein
LQILTKRLRAYDKSPYLQAFFLLFYFGQHPVPSQTTDFSNLKKMLRKAKKMTDSLSASHPSWTAVA